jgi:hypothetical protein
VVEDVEKIRSRLKSKPLPESELPPQRPIDLRRAESAQGVSSQISLPPALRIDPARIRRNPLAPPVAIRSMVADGKPYPVSQDAALPPLTRNLRIGYAALSLSIPERVRARYKLEGSDKDWQDAGNRRDAFYTNLGPRKYTFRVIACNNDGIWNETGASWSFEIEPAFYQTAWFHVLYVLAGATMIWLVYRFRLRQMTARVNLRYTERLAERTRIARELHDTLLQEFSGVGVPISGGSQHAPPAARRGHASSRRSPRTDGSGHRRGPGCHTRFTLLDGDHQRTGASGESPG